MDKRVLNEDELNYLRQFIKSRGFHEPSTAAEILDHFACKVEDLLMEEPSLSFETAARKVHFSFGVRGFADIAKAYEEGLKKKYRTIYGRYIKEFIRKPLNLIAIVALGFLTVRVYLWAVSHSIVHFLDKNDLSTGLWLCLLIAEFGLIVQTPRGGSKNLIIRQGMRPYNVLFQFAWWYFIFHDSYKLTPHGQYIHAWIHGIMVVGAVCHYVARYKTFYQAKELYKEFKMLAE